MNAQKRSWNSFLLWTIPTFAIVIVILLMVVVGIEVSVLVKPVPLDDKTAQYADLVNKQLWMRATQITMGYVLGVLCVGAGVVFVWNGIEAAARVEASQSDARLIISTGSVGLVTIIIGALLVSAVVLSSPVHIGPASKTGGPEAGGPPRVGESPVAPFLL